MPYCKRTVIAGSVIEHKKMMTPRVHSKGVTRKPNHAKTGDAQARCNERKSEENLRWTINANYKAGDYHVVLHYFDKNRELD